MQEPFRQKLSPLSGSPGRPTASASVPAGSPWYAGHFPGSPLLPGIAVLALAEEAICEAERRQGREVTMTGISRVRFRLPVRPDDRMVIQISREDRAGSVAYGFSVFLSDDLACSGFFTLRAAAGPLGP